MSSARDVIADELCRMHEVRLGYWKGGADAILRALSDAGLCIESKANVQRWKQNDMAELEQLQKLSRGFDPRVCVTVPVKR